jgi:glucose/mannose transport system substrate-binding protein
LVLNVSELTADALLVSCVHGAAAPATFQQELNDAMILFVLDRNVERFTGALDTAPKTMIGILID